MTVRISDRASFLLHRQPDHRVPALVAAFSHPRLRPDRASSVLMKSWGMMGTTGSALLFT